MEESSAVIPPRAGCVATLVPPLSGRGKDCLLAVSAGGCIGTDADADAV